MDIQNKVALVTGGANGIGLACVKELLNNGARGVTIVDITETGQEIAEKLNKEFPANSPKVIFVKADVVDKSSLNGAFKATIDAFSNLDIVINNAGVLSEIDWEKCYDVNLKGVTNGITLALEEYLPKYKSTSDAVIVNTASISSLEAWEPIPIYTATKFGVLGLTLAFGGDFHFKRTGVRVIAICPGATDTVLATDFDKKMNYPEVLKNMLKLAKSQDTDVVVKTFIHAIKEGKSASLYVIDGGERKKIVYPKIF